MRITILGCGYVGAALARHWHGRRELRVRVTTTRSERLPELAPLASEVVVAQGNDPAGLRQALEGSEAVVLCLAPGGSRLVGPELYEATYLATFRTLAALLPELPALRQLIYTGSCSVYGDAAGGWVDENTPPAPRDRHGEILLEGERLLQGLRCPGRRVCLFRLGALYGPGRELIPRLARVAGEVLPGDGHPHGSWIHRDDVVAALDLALQQGLDGLWNLVDDEPITNRELFRRVCQAGGLAPVRWDPARSPDSPPADRRISNRRLRALGLRLHHPTLSLTPPPDPAA
ncbi:MAG: NAD-dependent epimerase/dehydratase family protein [Synechococcus sp.]|nr:NAD-dependent epimerase/dehydratase family protein [Synechococcus sp.]